MASAFAITLQDIEAAAARIAVLGQNASVRGGERVTVTAVVQVTA